MCSIYCVFLLFERPWCQSRPLAFWLSLALIPVVGAEIATALQMIRTTRAMTFDGAGGVHATAAALAESQVPLTIAAIYALFPLALAFACAAARRQGDEILAPRAAAHAVIVSLLIVILLAADLVIGGSRQLWSARSVLDVPATLAWCMAVLALITAFLLLAGGRRSPDAPPRFQLAQLGALIVVLALFALRASALTSTLARFARGD